MPLNKNKYCLTLALRFIFNITKLTQITLGIKSSYIPLNK